MSIMLQSNLAITNHLRVSKKFIMQKICCGELFLMRPGGSDPKICGRPETRANALHDIYVTYMSCNIICIKYVQHSNAAMYSILIASCCCYKNYT